MRKRPQRVCKQWPPACLQVEVTPSALPPSTQAAAPPLPAAKPFSSGIIRPSGTSWVEVSGSSPPAAPASSQQPSGSQQLTQSAGAADQPAGASHAPSGLVRGLTESLLGQQGAS